MLDIINSHFESPTQPDPQAQRLYADVAKVRARLGQLREWSGGHVDTGRILGLVSAADGAQALLPYTIPNLLRQVAAAGKYADILLGLNNGFTCDPLLDYLRTLPDVEVLRLYTRRAADPAPLFSASPALTAAPVLLTQLPAPAARHRVIVVDPQAHGDSAWKMRMLGEMVLGLLLPSLRAGWRPPQYTLLFDAESLFIAHSDDRSIQRELQQVRLLQQKIPDDPARIINIIVQAQARAAPAAAAAPAPLDWRGPGLELLIATLDQRPELALLGAITRFCVYDTPGQVAQLPVLLPNLAAPCSPMHEIYQYTCGLFDGCACMPGGGTLGRTLEALALLAMIATCYPATICEDSMLTVLAQHAELKMDLCADVYLTNRCPPVTELTQAAEPRPAWQQQFVRWYAGFDAVEALYGRHNAARVLGLDPDLFFSACLALFVKRLKHTQDTQRSLAFLDAVLASGQAYQEIRALARATASA